MVSEALNQVATMMHPSITIIVVREDPRIQDAQILLDESSAAFAIFSGDSGQSRFRTEDLCSARGEYLIARTAQGEPLGCGAFRRFDYGVAEVTRIYSRQSRIGVGQAILRKLELGAVTAGYHTLITEAPSSNKRAVRFYEHNGFTPAAPFGVCAQSPGVCYFSKALCSITA
jgi:ribosomal protein S18 acetylase RimI-like enzyme